jgi:hypothetical protein
MTHQAKIDHPLSKFGYSRPPHWLWRASPRAYVVASAIKDICLIVTGRLTLHRAWQDGSDQGSSRELSRQLRGGK